MKIKKNKTFDKQRNNANCMTFLLSDGLYFTAFWLLDIQMVSPMPLFTPEDLLRYLYKESSPELTAAIQVALKENWTLREQMEELQTSVNQLDIEKQIFAPRMEVVERVLQYARNTAIEATSKGWVHAPLI